MDHKRKNILDKADSDLYRLSRFFQLAAGPGHLLPLAETIRIADIRLTRIEQSIGTARGSRAADRLKTLKRLLKGHITIQKRAMDVFERDDALDPYLNIWIPNMYCTRREWMLRPGGVEALLTELGQIEHGVIR